MEPQIQYTHAADGVAIAYAVVGEGPPLLFALPLLNPGLDDEIARPSPHWPSLTGSRSVVLWDTRGQGLSGSAPGAGFDDWLADIDAVADAACTGRFDLVGWRTTCHLALAYATRRPDRVDRMVLYNPGLPGGSLRRIQPAWLFARAFEDWHDFVDILALREFGWDRADAAQRWADRIRAHFTPEQFLHLMDVAESTDITPDAGSIRTPTLVIDDPVALSRIDQARRGVRTQQFVRQLAAAIPGAQLMVIKPGGAPAAEGVQRFLSGGAADARPEASTASGTAIILFADIVDSTALTERMGDTAFRTASRSLDEGMRAAMRDLGGTPVEGKVLGDGVMGVFKTASQAIAAARPCIELSAESELQLHVGLHAGDVTHEAGNVYGGAVNIASRICGLSAPEEVLVSATVRDLARTSAGVTFEDRGEHALKGIEDAVRVYAVRPGGA